MYEYDKLALVYDTTNSGVTYINWIPGNTCTYACTYCHPSLHSGTIAWPSIDLAMSVFKNVTDHYKNKLGRQLFWIFLGGEPIIWKDFLKFLKLAKEYDPSAYIHVITNGKRTIKWWNKAKHLIDQISFTAHIEFVDLIELREVINEVGDTIPQIGILVPVIPAKWNDCLEALEILKDTKAYNFLRLKFLWELDHYNGIEKFRQEHLGYKGTKYTEEQKEIINNLIYQKPNNKWPKYKWSRKLCTIKENEIIQSYRGHQLIGLDANAWKGWKCYAGIESLSLDGEGNIKYSMCGAEGILGNWRTNPNSIQWPNDPIICPYEICGCAADLIITKEKIQ